MLSAILAIAFHAPFDVPFQVKQGLTMETHCGILRSLIGFFKPIFLFPRLCDSCRRDSHFFWGNTHLQVDIYLLLACSKSFAACKRTLDAQQKPA